jgi:hypothetical protein
MRLLGPRIEPKSTFLGPLHRNYALHLNNKILYRDQSQRRTSLKYIVSHKTRFGLLSIECDNPKQVPGAFSELRQLVSSIQTSESKAKEARAKREGKGETTAVLRTLESRLLNTNFFSTPRTTGETRERLVSLTRKRFTSRKVSQALGILMERRVLRRTGRRNFFKYTTA